MMPHHNQRDSKKYHICPCLSLLCVMNNFKASGWYVNFQVKKGRFLQCPLSDLNRFLRITVDGDDFGSKKTYIATQGCLPSTRADFWQMVWQVKWTLCLVISCRGGTSLGSKAEALKSCLQMRCRLGWARVQTAEKLGLFSWLEARLDPKFAWKTSLHWFKLV